MAGRELAYGAQTGQRSGRVAKGEKGVERFVAWIARYAPGVSGEALQEQMVRQLNQRRAGLIQQCENFLQEYPDDKRAASVAWLAATAESLQLDRYDPESPVMVSVAAMALPASASAWKRVVEQYPESPQALLGHGQSAV